MSKILETLDKGGAEIAQLIKPLVDTPQKPAPGRDGNEAPKTESHAPNPAAVAERFLAQVRKMALHIPAPSPVMPFEEGQWEASEQYRVLRTKIVQHPKQPHVMVISSPAPGDGKSVTSINLAGALSLKSEARVLLMDADFRKSAIHVQLGLPQTPGLVDVFRGACAPEEAIVNAVELPNLHIMCAGGPPPANPVELLDNAAWPVLCSKLRTVFRYIVIDSPPVAAVADFDLIQEPCDTTILVVRPDRTNRALLNKSLEIVPKGKLLGVLLNCVPKWFLLKNHSASYYYYYYSHGGRKKIDESRR